MAQNLLIVESPAKAKTIKKYLGKSFQVLASYGHVLDIPAKQGAIDPERDFKDKNFEPEYVFIEKNMKHIEAIAKAMEKAESLYLATDPDREGEAISWHIYKILKDKKLLQKKPVHRVAFYQITKNAVTEAIQNPRKISEDLIHAQLARRTLDFLVGFNLSPLLWRKIRPGLSAGRVQSPALRMIVEREEEIERFQPQEYWTLEAFLNHSQQNFTARLLEYKNKKLEQFDIINEKQAHKIRDELTKAAQGHLLVTKIDTKQRKRNPAAPFITSTLQQEAVRKLGFSAYKTMRVAQQLYEGIDIGNGPQGLITYMRTDSVNVAPEAINEIRDTIQNIYGSDVLPDVPNTYKSKVKNAQEAHEAIRPTSAAITPDNIKKVLSEDQFRLYELIWKRTLASQMIPATLEIVSVNLACGDIAVFRANGSVVKVPGFLTIYQEDADDANKDDDQEKRLPALQENEKIPLEKINAEQHFTEPPPRYSEATLIKALEEYGIGRPSTYASIISTILHREYVSLEQKRFKPTDVGRIVNKFLTQYFQQYVDYNFTAQLEDELDEISRGEKQWVPMMKTFWKPFKNLLDDIAEHVKRKDVTQEQLDEKCPECGKPLVKRLGKRGSFIGCTGYPECTYTRTLDDTPESEAEAKKAAETIKDRTCPKCGGELHIKVGRYGKFIGCSNYPKCKHIEPLQKPEDTHIQCPECKQGTFLKRMSRYKRVFYSCSRYPDCKYAIWNEPIAETCPNCQWPILTIKTTKRRGTEKVCPRKECGFHEAMEVNEKEEK